MTFVAGSMAAGRSRDEEEEEEVDEEAGAEDTSWVWHQLLKPQSSPPVTHLLQQGHTLSNKATPPDRATSHGPSICKPPHLG